MLWRGHTAQKSRKRMNHAQNLVVRVYPSRIWPFSLIYVMKNHRWIAQEHAKITNKPRTSAHRHAKAPNRANTWLCAKKGPRKTTHNLRTITNEVRMNRAWFGHELRKECMVARTTGARVASVPRIYTIQNKLRTNFENALTFQKIHQKSIVQHFGSKSV